MAETYKTKADYTILKKNHVNSSQGDIIESDFMTISPMDNIFDGTEQDIINSDSNFKFSYRISNNTQKKHSKNAWIKTPDGEGDVWKLNDTISGGSISDETIIRIKPDYSSLKDFAYYGSAIELVRGSMNDIIQNFPAEIYFTNITLRNELIAIYGDDDINVPSGRYISNDFGIDFHTPHINELDAYNKMRYFTLAYNLYDFIDASGNTKAITGVEISLSGATCSQNNTGVQIAEAIITVSGRSTPVRIKTLLKDGNYHLYTSQNLIGCRIRPCNEVVENYFNTIDDFEYILLNRDSNPLYKAEFDTPYETDRGNYYKKKSYIFPSNYNWNPDISTIAYENYLESLLELAEFHDNLDSNNIWRSMTHEAIKNLDWTFVREQDGEKEDVNIDSSKVELIMQLYGRQYDGLKRYIDNIKNTNNITYNQKNNTPDYFLTDEVDIDGWDVKPIIATAKTSFTSDALFENMSRGYSEVEANNGFMRNLKLNSNYILSSKGTRKSIESLLGLLGVSGTWLQDGSYERDYEIREFIAIANGKSGGYCHFVPGLNNYRYPNAEDISFVNNKKYSVLNSNGIIKPYMGIAVKEVEAKNGGKYVVPWYVNGENYDSNLYFQSKGGWGKRNHSFGDKEINLDCTTATTFNVSDFNKYYSETQTYLKFARNVQEMLDFSSNIVSSGMICYVTDNEYAGSTSGDSHYFVLHNPSLSTHIGYVNSFNDYGWTNITQSDLNSVDTTGVTPEAKMVVYLESLIETTEGNNSHVGFGKYDDGIDYLYYIDNIFQGSKENGDLENFSNGDIENAIDTYRFNIENKAGEVDEKKCWYFGEGDGSWERYTGATIVNPEGGNLWEEPAANSIINTKKMEIWFYYPNCFFNYETQVREELESEYKKYIENTVIPYIMQVIPSTTIFSFDILHHGDSPTPERAIVTPVNSINQTSSNYVPRVDGLIYTDEDYANGLDMIDENNIIRM